ncbi:PilZ domain-containing protein [Sphingosinicella sp. CPCC 101087]|uniref:PilZ domain-containing protein n=1 Tax=Sphingosinicella sp. CPCC 101087 TaxID=2497754 RepID=UPI00101BC649|nr:PilZ domain-containing protein [Sphingosinicella sp. CPCC 101087]
MNSPTNAKGYEALRASRRLKVFQPATLLGADGRLRVHLLDVSRTGVLGHAASPPAPGSRVELDCAGQLRPALVRWNDGPRFGLEFEQPLPDERMEQIARQGGALPPTPAD